MKLNIYMNGELSQTITLQPQELEGAKRAWVSEGAYLVYEVYEPE